MANVSEEDSKQGIKSMDGYLEGVARGERRGHPIISIEMDQNSKRTIVRQ